MLLRKWLRIIESKLQITKYYIKAPVKKKIAVVADLHGQGSLELLEKLRKIHPDIIAMPGDILDAPRINCQVDKGDKSLSSRIVGRISYAAEQICRLVIGQEKSTIDATLSFLKEAGSIAPVVMSLGNHEGYVDAEDIRKVSDQGVILLDNASTQAEGIWFGGLSSEQIHGELDTRFLDEYAREDGYRILLCHHPEYYDRINDCGCDLVLAGHTHGGQIRIGTKGLFAPGQGILPKYSRGIYDHMIVSAGMANTTAVPRWGNPCEILVLELGEAYAGITN